MFALPSSPGGVADGWDGIVATQLQFHRADARLREKWNALGMGDGNSHLWWVEERLN
jgi:hypothetical protein